MMLPSPSCPWNFPPHPRIAWPSGIGGALGLTPPPPGVQPGIAVTTRTVSAEREAQRRTARSDPRGWVENMGCTGLLQWLSMRYPREKTTSTSGSPYQCARRGVLAVEDLCEGRVSASISARQAVGKRAGAGVPAAADPAHLPPSSPTLPMHALRHSIVAAVLTSGCATHGTAPGSLPAAPVQYPSTYVRPAAPPVLIRNATILTAAGPEMQHASILFAEGKVVSVGTDSLSAPADAVVVDGTGRFVTPGHHRHPLAPRRLRRAGHRAPTSDGNEATAPVDGRGLGRARFWPQDPEIPRARRRRGHRDAGAARLGQPDRRARRRRCRLVPARTRAGDAVSRARRTA